MARRLFHAIVLMGTGMAAACSGSTDEPPVVTADTGAADGAIADSGVDTYANIMPMMLDSAPVDSGSRDDTATDTYPMIMADTFPGIMPMMVDSGDG